MGWMALIRAALEGAAAFKFFWLEIKDLNLKARLEKIDENQRQMNEAVTLLASAQTLEERDEALKKLALSGRN
jgi:hypothetical protein